MSRASSIWKPVYTITPQSARLLMEIETARVEVELTAIYRQYIGRLSAMPARIEASE